MDKAICLGAGITIVSRLGNCSKVGISQIQVSGSLLHIEDKAPLVLTLEAVVTLVMGAVGS